MKIKSFLVIILLSFILCSCVEKEAIVTIESHQGYSFLKEPKEYNDIDDFTKNMKELSKKSEKELLEIGDGISIKQFRKDFFFEPQKLPKGAEFNKITMRDVYIALEYIYPSSILDTLTESEKKRYYTDLISEYSNYIVYVWNCGSDEQGLRSLVSDNPNMKEINKDELHIFYSEVFLADCLIDQEVEISSGMENNVIRRDFYYMQDGEFIHVIVPGDIGLDEVDKYLFVKKRNY